MLSVTIKKKLKIFQDILHISYENEYTIHALVYKDYFIFSTPYAYNEEMIFKQ